MPATAPTLDDRIDAATRALDARGFLTLPPGGWPGATPDALKRALTNFYAVVEALGLDTEWLEDGTRIAFRPHNDEDRPEATRTVPKNNTDEELTHRCEPL